MNRKRFTEIVESYGADADRWPADERRSAEEFCRTSQEATHLLKQEAELDQQLSVFQLPENQASLNQTKMKILENLKPDPLERLINWILPDFDDLTHTLWRPALATCMPLIIGVAIGIGVPGNDAFELTADEEFNLLAMTETVSEEWNYE